jgi:hypothetical protein
MNQGKRIAVALACLLPLLVLGWAGSARALYLGNPAPDFKRGNFGLGLSLSNDRETAFADYGLSDAGTVELQVGDLDVGASHTGLEVGLTYRHKLGQPFKLGQFPVTLGVLGGYRVARVSNPGGDLNFNQIHLGLGGAFTPVQHLNVYGALIYERAKADTVLPLGKISGTETNLGVSLGTEYWITPSIVAGLELHPGLDDDGLAIFGEFKF